MKQQYKYFQYCARLKNGELFIGGNEATSKDSLKNGILDFLDGDPDLEITEWLSVKQETKKSKRKDLIYLAKNNMGIPF